MELKTKSLKCESLGEFTLTAYCGCSRCCGKSNGKTATGVKAKANHTIAVDPKTIPYGTEVLIDGQKYVAEDCGSAVKGKHIDIFFSTHKEAVIFLNYVLFCFSALFTESKNFRCFCPVKIENSTCIFVNFNE